MHFLIVQLLCIAQFLKTLGIVKSQPLKNNVLFCQ